MATLKPLKSATLEGAFLEVAFLLEKLETGLNHHKNIQLKLFERDLAAEPVSDKPAQAIIIEEKKRLLAETSYFTITVDTDQQRAVIVATMPARIKENSFGGYLLAKEIFSDEELSRIPDAILES